MAKRFSHLLERGKRGARRRFAELVNEVSVLLASFPHLRDAVDADELPVSFIMKRDSRYNPKTCAQGCLLLGAVFGRPFGEARFAGALRDIPLIGGSVLMSRSIEIVLDVCFVERQYNSR